MPWWKAHFVAIYGIPVHFAGQFWHLVAKWLPGGLRRLILSNSATWWPTGSQVASEGSF